MVQVRINANGTLIIFYFSLKLKRYKFSLISCVGTSLFSRDTKIFSASEFAAGHPHLSNIDYELQHDMRATNTAASERKLADSLFSNQFVEVGKMNLLGRPLPMRVHYSHSPSFVLLEQQYNYKRRQQDCRVCKTNTPGIAVLFELPELVMRKVPRGKGWIFILWICIWYFA